MAHIKLDPRFRKAVQEALNKAVTDPKHRAVIPDLLDEKAFIEAMQAAAKKAAAEAKEAAVAAGAKKRRRLTTARLADAAVRECWAGQKGSGAVLTLSLALARTWRGTKATNCARKVRHSQSCGCAGASFLI